MLEEQAKINFSMILSFQTNATVTNYLLLAKEILRTNKTYINHNNKYIYT